MFAARMLVASSIFVATTACVRSHATQCGDAVCPQDSACIVYSPTGGTFCVPERETECRGVPDGTLCDERHGTCYGGGCFPVGCGNGHIDDPVYQHPEECDDSNRMSHDGCSSSCTNEVATWTAEAPAPAPSLFNHAMAFDAGTNTTVAFGGQAQVPSAETWLRIGSRWQYVVPAEFSPAPRVEHAMAYDAARGRVVLFGGRVDGTANRETWVWEGGRWTLLTPAHAPPARSRHAMAYDSIRKLVVLYGGADGASAPLGDTWAWDGVDWVALDISGPPPFVGHAMAFDASHGEIVMVGGTASATTWRFDGGQWSLAASAGPPGGTSIALAYDPVVRGVVWSGDNAGALAQWLWTGTEWQSRTVTELPAGRSGMAATTDAAGPLVYGGVAGVSATALASSWDGTSWRQTPVSASPPFRTGMAIASDQRRGRIQIFGDDTGSLKDSWELARAGWIESPAPFPLAGAVSVVPAVAVYDEVHQSAVVVRGTKTSTWNGATWMDDAFASPDVATPQMAYVPGLGVVLVGSITVTEGSVRSPVHLFVHDGGGWVDRGQGPPERTAAAVGYDPVSRQVVVFGGYTKGGTRQVSLPLNDTWVWDVTTGAWSEVFPTTRPPSRSGASLAWDRARGRLALVQGAMTVWEWDRARVSWHPILTAGSPEPVTTSLAVSAPDGDGLVVGGTVAHAGASSVGLYRLKWSGPGPLESCEGRQDLDRDGLAGCDDPDCEVTCAQAALTCGNAVCEDTESCGLCPQDCGTCRERCGDFTCSSVETAETCPGDCTVMP